MQPKYGPRASSFSVVITGLTFSFPWVTASQGQSHLLHKGLVILHMTAIGTVPADTCKAVRTTMFDLLLFAFVDYLILLEEVVTWWGRWEEEELTSFHCSGLDPVSLVILSTTEKHVLRD